MALAGQAFALRLAAQNSFMRSDWPRAHLWTYLCAVGGVLSGDRRTQQWILADGLGAWVLIQPATLVADRGVWVLRQPGVRTSGLLRRCGRALRGVRPGFC